jgi:hypothetical protein
VNRPLTRRAVLAGGAALAGATAALVGMPALLLAAADETQPQVAGFATRDIPEQYLRLFLQHGEPPIDWSVLAAVAWRESGWNPEVTSCRVDSDAGARGLMQLLPDAASALDVDPCDPAQAVEGAAELLHAHHSEFASLELALAAYHAGAGAVRRHGGVSPYPETEDYVSAVLDRADRYDATSAGVRLGALGDAVASLLELADADRIQLPFAARRDLQHPNMDPRVPAILLPLAERHRYAVSVVKTGHSRCVGGGSTCPPSGVSNHWHYRAVDIYRIDGEPVHRGSDPAAQLVEWTARVEGQLRPDEVG